MATKNRIEKLGKQLEDMMAREHLQGHRKEAYAKGDPEDIAAAQELMCDVLSTLRALHWHHWTTHWIVKNDPYYGDHLLFDRLYTDMQEEIDQLAEKMVAYFGAHAVEPRMAMKCTSEKLDLWWGPSDEWTGDKDVPIYIALNGEQYLQDLLQNAYDSIKQVGQMTLGLDDYIMALANTHETYIYLLQQRLGGRP